MTTARCAVVIPAHAAAATIARTLRALERESSDAEFDVPVVVASPADDTADVAERLGAHVVRTPERLGAGAARNLGRRHAGNPDLVLFIDADCAPRPGALRSLRVALDSDRLDAVGASVVSEPAGAVAWVRHVLEFKDAEPGCEPAWPGFVPSATFLCRTQAFDAVGGFPDLWPGEDLVLCSRLLRAGFRVRRVDGAVTIHRHPSGVGKLLQHQHALGATSAHARRMTEIEGSSLVGRRGAAPLLFAGRTLRMGRWLVRHHPSDLPRAIGASPLYFAGLAAWCTGFARGQTR